MTPWRRLRVLIVAALLTAPISTAAHVGSPDVFVDGQAGPYRLLVTVRPPLVIPGSAAVEILAASPSVRIVRIVPTPLTGAAARFAPTPDVARRSKDDPRLFSGDLWMMTAGAWEVRVSVEGDDGMGTIAVPVPTLPQATTAMSPGLGALLIGFMVLLAAGLISIVAAMAREAGLAAGEPPNEGSRRRGHKAAAIASLAVTGILALGNWWWTLEATAYSQYVYKPLEASTSVSTSGNLSLTLFDPGWIALRRLDDIVPDHGHAMHLFIVSPLLDRLWHLHPREMNDAAFEQQLPDVPSGRYAFFADIVHATGLSETATGQIDTTGVHGAPLAGDDSAWSGPARVPAASSDRADLPDGSRMVWVRDGQPLRPRTLTLFTFRVEDATGQPVTDLELYMGMPGHAVFVRRDLQVFAHVHPAGSAPMAAMEIGRRSLRAAGSDDEASSAPATSAMPMDHGQMPSAGPLLSTVSFPYGFPSAGDYRIFVQVKRQGRVETGAFDAHVE